MVLRSGGHFVESACSIGDALHRFQTGDFDLVLLCHSIPERERHNIVSFIRNSGSATPVILVAPAPAPHTDGLASQIIDSSPAVLLRSLNKVLDQARPARAKPKNGRFVDK